MAKKWLRLASVDGAAVATLRQRWGGVGGLDGLAELAGFECRVIDDRLHVREVDRPVLFRARPLQTSTGELRSKVRGVIGPGIGRVVDVDALHGRLADGAVGPSTSATKVLQLEALMNDEGAIVQRIMETTPSAHLFALQSTERVWQRLAWWRAVRALDDGVSADVLQPRLTSQALSGMLELQPAALILFPLQARAWPFATSFMLRAGQQVTAVGDGPFRRPVLGGVWPVAHLSIGVFAGVVDGLYQDAHNGLFDRGVDLVRDLTGRAGDMINHVTDPALWARDGVLDVVEQQLFYGSVLLAVDALAEASADYNGTSSLWACLRALDILRGLWTTTKRGTPRLSELLAVPRLRQHVVASIDGPLHGWAERIVAIYQRQLIRCYGRHHQQGPRRLEQVRHLLHGARGPSQAERLHRVEVLNHLQDQQFPTSLLMDIAVLWWTAALYNPKGILTPGVAPWSTNRP
ncbi:hypothetical protein [Euzebya sp.]|uniref:hypothetical protein n=1 Tax=Euzebya sp. TaxID=1971409 RepID=UPI003519D2E8